jgi:uncharacterized damage-inducible protein DinB
LPSSFFLLPFFYEALMDKAVALLVRLLEQSYDRKAWHGPNLRGSLRGLSPEQAAWRPAPGGHSIQELALHCAYWKYTVVRRLTGAKRGSFPLQGSNFFTRPGIPTLQQWKADLRLLADTHRDLIATVRALRDRDLSRMAPGGTSTMTIEAVVYGVGCHDVYHAGQIQLIKRRKKAKGRR